MDDSRRYSFTERAKIFARIDRLNALKERKARLYNYFWRRSLVFVSATVMRILYLFFFAWIWFYNGGSGEVTKEIVTSRKEFIYSSSKKFTVRELRIETQKGKYVARFEIIDIPVFSPGDTILIEHNWFGKPTFFSRGAWDDKYELSLNWVLYFLIGMLTVISLAFNDGLDRMADKIIWLAWTANIFGIMHYFLS